MKHIKLFEGYASNRKGVIIGYEESESDYYVAYTEESLPDEYREEYNSMKFHLGDYVKHRNYGNSIFVVDKVQLEYRGIENYHIKDIEYDEPKIWCGAISLTLIPDYEIAARKYNL